MKLVKGRHRRQSKRGASFDGFAAALCDMPSASRERVDVQSRESCILFRKDGCVGWKIFPDDLELDLGPETDHVIDVAIVLHSDQEITSGPASQPSSLRWVVGLCGLSGR